MIVPDGLTETGVVHTINNIINLLAPDFVFGFNTIEDVRQEGWIFALKILPKFNSYDERGNRRPLENFMYVGLFRSYLNYYRDHYHKPCPVQLTSGVLPKDEQRYERWKGRNASVKKVLMPTAISESTHVYKDDEIVNIEIDEVEKIIDERLDVDLRADYLRMKSGVSIPHVRRTNVTNAVKQIINTINLEV